MDIGQRVLVVGRTKTEAGSGRPVPLTQPAWTALDMWASRFPKRQPDDYVFPQRKVEMVQCKLHLLNGLQMVGPWGLEPQTSTVSR